MTIEYEIKTPSQIHLNKELNEMTNAKRQIKFSTLET